MAYQYDIQTSKMDKTSSSCLFACHSLGAVISIFVSTFLIAYIYQFSTDTFDYIFNVGVYELSVYGTFLLTYWAFSYLTDKSNRVWIYRLAQIIRLVFIVSIIFFGRELAQMLYLAGFLYGLCESSYYASYNVLKQEMVSRKVMSKFSVLITISSKTADILIPVTLGALIQISTYEQTSIYVAIIVGLILFLSFFIKSKKPDNSTYSIKNFLKKLKENPDAHKKMSFMYKATIFYGLTTITGTLLNICIMLQFNSSLSLGGITSIIGVVAIIELMLVTKFTKGGKRSWVYWLVTIMPLVSSVLFVIYPSMTTVVIYSLLMTLSKIIFTAFYDVYRNSTLKEAGLYSEIAEHQTIIESVMTMARVASYVIMILVGLLRNLVVYEILLIVFSLSYSAINFCLMLYEKKFIKNAQKVEENSEKTVKNSEN